VQNELILHWWAVDESRMMVLEYYCAAIKYTLVDGESIPKLIQNFQCKTFMFSNHRLTQGPRHCGSAFEPGASGLPYFAHHSYRDQRLGGVGGVAA